MGLSLGKIRGRGASRWPDLPPDLAGLILRRLPSHADRLSFGAVCHDWRLAAELQRLPAMPWVRLSFGSYQCIVEDKSYRFAGAPGEYYHLSFGSWLLYEHSNRLLLRDHLSEASSAIEIPCSYHECADGCDAAGHDRSTAKALMTSTAMARFSMYKIVVCSSHLLAAILYTRQTLDEYNFAFFRPGALSWSLLRATDYRDIAFYRGQIFAVSSSEELFVHDLIQPCRANRVIEKRPATATDSANLNLVVSSDETKLLMVRWSVPSEEGAHHDMIKLQVFEADLDRKEWSEVKDLGDQVLFISDACSRAIGSSFMEHHADSRLRGGNRVFLPSASWHWYWFCIGSCRCCFCDKFHSSIPYYCVYDMTNGTHSVVSLSGCRLIHNPVTEWFFPY